MWQFYLLTLSQGHCKEQSYDMYSTLLKMKCYILQKVELDETIETMAWHNRSS